MYKLVSDEIEGLKAELSLYLGRISERLDSVQGVRGDIDLGSHRVVSGSDFVSTHGLGGIVLRDDGNPPSYWKYMAKNNGTLIAYELGGDYKDPLLGEGKVNVIPGGYDGEDVTIIGGEIGGWVISSSSLSKNNATLASAGTLTLGSGTDICIIDSTDANYRLVIGHSTYASAPFRVSKEGAVTAVSGTIGGWTLAPTTLSSANIVLDDGNDRIRSSNYVAGSAGTGFTLEPDLLEVGNIACRGIFRTGVFQKDVISAVGGNIAVTKSADVLATDMTAQDASTLTIEGNVTFTVGDFLRIKNENDDEWLEVTNIGSAPTYTVTRDKAADYAANTNPVWKKGASVVNYGASGDGGILMTASETNAPYMSVFTHAGVPWTTQTTRLRVGNLNGYLGYASDLYGIAIGETTKYLKYDPTNGLQVKGMISVDVLSSINADIGTITAGIVKSSDGKIQYDCDNKWLKVWDGSNNLRVHLGYIP
uniref:Uncharacterized protein n=1 Tax=viral metagenome TaxID=1070528 RepID=A0A6M3KZG2_9ZZZZ